MQLSDFDYDLPNELIARYPLDQRASSRMLILNKDSGEVSHGKFTQLIDFLNPGDLLILNDSKVIPARFFATKPTGGKVEVLVERILASQRILCHIKASKSPKIGSKLLLHPQGQAEVIAKTEDLYEIIIEGEKTALQLLELIGHMPLPPYMHRDDELSDKNRYQTVYSKIQGSVAAPTAGLHFDEDTLAKLRAKGVNIEFVTLHVGAGTFQPVRVEKITEHKMHAEWLTVSEKVCQAVQATKASGGRVIAVGTTSVRSLETACSENNIKPFNGESKLFIYPGYQFKCVDVILTNFHLPKSSLLMLVAAFAGHSATMTAYAQAIQEKYRFFSYGDCMLITA